MFFGLIFGLIFGVLFGVCVCKRYGRLLCNSRRPLSFIKSRERAEEYGTCYTLPFDKPSQPLVY